MTLLISLFAAIIATICWYVKLPDSRLKLHILALMFWGSSIMWFVDAVFEYAKEGVAFFEIDVHAMISDGFLGLCIVALGLALWIITLLILDSRNVLKGVLTNR